MPSLFSFAVLALVLGRLTDGPPQEQHCSAPPVMQGETAVLTFNLRQDINNIPGNVYTVLRREKSPAHDIMTCERNSPWQCDVKDPADQQKSKIVNHTLTLYINNITKDLEDIYTLKIYVNDSLEPTISCKLRVQTKPRLQLCSAPRVMEGDTGVMRFSVRKELLASPDVFSATLMRADSQEKILTCSRQSPSAGWTCDIHDPHFQTDGFGQQNLTILIPEVTKNFEGMYLLLISATSTEQSVEPCYLRVNDVPVAARAEQGLFTIAVALIIIFLGITTVCLVVMTFPQVRNLLTRCGLTMFDKDKVIDESAQPFLSLQNSESHQQKRWYIEELSKKKEEELLQFKNNRPGSFLVRRSRNNPKHHVLAVLLADGMRYLTIVPHEKGFKCPSTHNVFPTLCALVHHYQHHDIEVKNKPWGMLSKPIEREPEGDWYFGQLASGHAEKILQRNGNGSFLVTVSNIDDDGYDLSVNFNGEIKRFGIIPDDENFVMLDTDKTAKTLSELVDYYQHNDLSVDEDRSYGKLGVSCGKDPEDVMKCDSFNVVEREFLNSKRKKPGSYLISGKSHNGGTEGRIFELVVYFTDKPKRFPFRRERYGFLFPATGMFFYSVHELLDFYRNHDIKIRHKTWGKLTQRFRKDPEKDWYFGPLGRDEERELLLSNSCRPNSFLVRDCISDPDEFTLAVRMNGDIVHHRVVPDDTGFSILNTDVVKGTLEELVQYYRDHELKLVDGTSYGKLTEPCKKDPPEDWYFENLNTREMDLVRKKARPGSFLVTKHETMQRTYTLLVFSQGGQERLKVTSVRNGLTCLTSDMFFYSWYELVAYYTEHDITVGDKHLGRLSKPFRKMCMSEWFSAPLSHEEESRLLLSTRCGTGSYLVRDGASDPKNYVLAVNFGGKVEMFTIIREDNKYGLLHEDFHHTFATVEELVNHYKTAKISVEGSEYGKLTRPFAT